MAERSAPHTRPFTIREAAERIGASPATIRLWERQGLLSPRRTLSGYRLYDIPEINRLRKISRLRQVDRLNAAAIRRVLAAEGDGAPRRRQGHTLGPRLRALRKARGLTLAQAAEGAGVSVSFLSAIEHDESGVAVATMRRVLGFYGTTLAELSASKTHALRQLTRDGKRRTVVGRFRGVRIEQLAEGLVMMEAQIFEVQPAGGSEGGYSHDGEEFIYVLEGSFEVSLAGIRKYRLERGDCLYFASTTEHSWRNPGKRIARLLWVNTPPTF
ncbi:MAG: MerR family transcriptional regulator [Candidatus Limnocylindria bacterium]